MTIHKSQLVERIQQRLSASNTHPVVETELIKEVLEATLEEITSSLKNKESVCLINFGTFYIRKEREGCVFKFNPSQRLRKIFGWASTHKGEP